MILNRIQDSRWSEVSRGWEGETVVIIGGGPSVTKDDVAIVAEHHADGRVRCIAVNDSYLLAPWADVHYAADEKWFKWHNDGIERPGMSAELVRVYWKTFKGQKCSIQSPSGYINEDEAVHVLRNRDHPNHWWGLSFDPKSIATGRNSGSQAMNIATLAGAKRILLLGFDGKPMNGMAHWFGDHPIATGQAQFEMFREAASRMQDDLHKAGVQVINCSVNSGIDTFKKKSLSEVLV